MRKQISVTNEKVLELFDKQQNVSKFIEKCVLAYHEANCGYVTREEVIELIESYLVGREINTPTDNETSVNRDDLECILDL